MLIAEINRLMRTTNRFMSVSRSRRFGKTMADNMLNAYFSKGCNSRELFKDLKIARNPCFEKYLNKYLAKCEGYDWWWSNPCRCVSVLEHDERFP